MNSYAFNIDIYEPVWIGDTFVARIDPEEISFQKAALGGSIMASISFKLPEVQMQSWLDGLGRHVVVKDHLSNIVWCGFVDQVDYKIGFLTISRGPLMEIWNRVKVMYTPYIDITVSPPVTGTQTETTITEDTDSQALYGIREFAVTGGTLVDALTVGGAGNDEAVQLRDTFLEDQKDASVTQQALYGRNDDVFITLNCLGYWSILSTYWIIDTNTGYQNLDDRVDYILDEDPNSILNTDKDLDANAYIMPRYDVNRTAMDVLMQAVSYGDVSANRWLFSFEGDRRAWYRQAPEEYEYIYRRDGVITNVAGEMLHPWQINAGKWMYFPDLVNYPAALTRDIVKDHPAYEFIEQVQFNSPYQATIIGSRITKAAQLLARSGM